VALPPAPDEDELSLREIFAVRQAEDIGPN
jgi:hypothetical protein